jgi:hypothetical protein
LFPHAAQLLISTGESGDPAARADAVGVIEAPTGRLPPLILTEDSMKA